MYSADYAVTKCPSVRRSHAGIVSTRLDISSVFSPSGSPSILVRFHTKRYGDILTGTPLKGASNANGYEKNHDFRPLSHVISELMQDRAIVTMEGKQETAPKLSNGTSLNHLE